jgi:hypothetical protein
MYLAQLKKLKLMNNIVIDSYGNLYFPIVTSSVTIGKNSFSSMIGCYDPAYGYKDNKRIVRIGKINKIINKYIKNEFDKYGI